MTDPEVASAPELAPFVVVRAARFPVRALEALADAALADASAGDRPSEDYARAYDTSVERQREVLWSLTAGDPRFLRAMTLTNEELTMRLVDKPRSAVRNKRARHLETTLYRYLARAVWRTEPCDLWAGMTLASWGEATRITPGPARTSITPDLRPFQSILQALSRTERYRLSGAYKLNPTLARAGETWRYSVREPSGALSPRERANRAWLAASIEVLEGCRPGPLEELAYALARHTAIEPARALEVVVALRDAGMVVGGLAFPARFASAWEALRAAMVDLSTDDARVWRRTLVRLRRLCLRLEHGIDGLVVSELRDAQAQVRQEIKALAAALGLAEPWLPRSILRCDQGLPFTIVLGPELRARFERTIAGYDAFEAHDGLDAAVRVAHRARLLEATRANAAAGPAGAAPGLPTQEHAWLAAGADEALGRRVRRWSRWLSSGAPEQVCRADVSTRPIRLGPLAAAILRPLPRGFAVLGFTPEVVPSYGRYALLCEVDALHAWYEASLDREAGKAGLDVVELVSPCEWAPNALARPRSRFPSWDVWGPSSSFRIRDVRVVQPRGTSAPVVVQDGHARPLSVACFAPADLARSDRALEQVLLSSFREVPDWISDALPFACELERPSPSPRLALDSGDVVRARRTVVIGDDLRALVRVSHRERFAIWQSLARRHGWPGLVLVSRDGGRPLLVVRDSPLAVEAALEGIGAHASFLTVEEPDDETWLEDADGARFATELIVPFLRNHHAWSIVDAGERPAPRASRER